MEKKDIINGLIWKFMERIGVMGGQFVLQILLARLLDPEHYGVLSLMVVFTTLANVFIQHGFAGALVQNKDVKQEDFSSVFWITLAIACGLYGLLFLAAPLIAAFYEMPDIVTPFRVLALILLPGALNSVQLAIVRRSMDFKKVFKSNIAAIVISGAAGILLACLGGGLWALVVQNLGNVLVACLVMWFTVKWRPRPVCDLSRVRVLFSYSWKLLASHLLDTLYQDLRSLVVGKKYDSGTLGYYDRGKQFPQFAMNAINSAIQSVMLPAMSAEQDDRTRVKTLMRHSITLSAYIIFPMMAGLAAVARPVITLLLTEKWLPAVPYMQIYCFTMAFYPVHSCNLQAINAMGRSDIFLRLEVIKKVYGLLALVIATFCFDSPLAIAATGIITTVISCFVNAHPNKELIGYSYFEQMRDILPSMLASLAMCGGVLLVGQIEMPVLLTLVVQILTGVVLYVGISWIFRLKAFQTMLRVIKKK